ncbi:hypothetical protein G5637_35260, partial [Klebsiella pneumoniae]|nr:hypothetical protein [Klebsiella pneumoniae]
FYSSSHDRFTYGSSFINFNLPQFYQILKTDGKTQVTPFHSTMFSQPVAEEPRDTAYPDFHADVRPLQYQAAGRRG